MWNPLRSPRPYAAAGSTTGYKLARKTSRKNASTDDDLDHAQQSRYEDVIDSYRSRSSSRSHIYGGTDSIDDDDQCSSFSQYRTNEINIDIDCNDGSDDDEEDDDDNDDENDDDEDSNDDDDDDSNGESNDADDNQFANSSNDTDQSLNRQEKRRRSKSKINNESLLYTSKLSRGTTTRRRTRSSSKAKARPYLQAKATRTSKKISTMTARYRFRDLLLGDFSFNDDGER